MNESESQTYRHMWTRPESIRSSPRYGLSTPYRLTIGNRAWLFHHVLFNMGDLYLVLPALKLSTPNAGRLMMFSLNMVDYSMSLILLSTWDFLLDKYPLKGPLWTFLTLWGLLCDPSFMLKSWGWDCASGYVVLCKWLCGGVQAAMWWWPMRF